MDVCVEMAVGITTGDGADVGVETEGVEVIVGAGGVVFGNVAVGAGGMDVDAGLAVPIIGVRVKVAISDTVTSVSNLGTVAGEEDDTRDGSVGVALETASHAANTNVTVNPHNNQTATRGTLAVNPTSSRRTCSLPLQQFDVASTAI